MKTDVKKMGKTTLKVVGAACAATGVVVVSAVIASGAAVSSIARGFTAAKKVITNIF